MAKSQKATDALRTIGELSDEIGISQFVLRYWEIRIPKLRPLRRTGNRRYYRPKDVELARRIQALRVEGYSVAKIRAIVAKKASDAPAPAVARKFCQ